MSTPAEIRIWRPAGVPGVELLRAVDTRHFFPKHFHDTRCVPLVERRAGRGRLEAAREVR